MATARTPAPDRLQGGYRATPARFSPGSWPREATKLAGARQTQWTPNGSGPNTRTTSHRVSGCWGAQNRTTLHRPPPIPGRGDFLPNSYPNRPRGGTERLYLLVTATNRSGDRSASQAYQTGHAGSIPSPALEYPSLASLLPNSAGLRLSDLANVHPVHRISHPQGSWGARGP